MSTASRKLSHAAARAASHSGAPSAGWLASIRDEAISFFKGDSNAPWAILAETVIGLVPVLGQIVDARDIIKALVEVSSAPASPSAWFNLITALIGLVPGGGDVVKRSLRVVKARAVPIDQLLDFIRQYYKGDPEKLLREMLDLGKLRNVLDSILDNPRLLSQLDEPARKQLQNMQDNLGKQFGAFKREVDEWLTQTPKTSAGSTHRGSKQPAQKPKTSNSAGSKNKKSINDRAQVDKPNPATQRAERFKRIGNKFMGVLGEHMADYHCQEIKGWGRQSKAAHDQGQTNAAKLNDNSRLVQLWPVLPRGRGIDAVWHKGSSAKPYAIIEAKASYNPAKTLNQLLGEAGDKNGRDADSGGAFGSSGRNKNRTTSQKQTRPRQANGKVTQMSKAWIENRLLKTALSQSSARQIINRGYSRHVLFFSIPHAVAHAEAIIKHIAKQPVQQAMHATHQVTREWGDNAISQVANNRANIPFNQRRAN